MAKTETSNWSEHVWLQKQKEVLSRREAFLKRFRTKDNHDQINSECFEDLKKLSPEKLVPVIFCSEAHSWMVGYLIQKVGAGGSRILAKLETWKILRVKKASFMKKISGKQAELDDLVLAQEQTRTKLVNLAGNHKKNGN